MRVIVHCANYLVFDTSFSYFRSEADPTHLVVVDGATLFKTEGSVLIISNRIGMKLGKIVLQVNTHRLTVSDFRLDVTLLRWWP